MLDVGGRLMLNFAILETIPWRHVESLRAATAKSDTIQTSRQLCERSWRLEAKRQMNVWCWW